MSIRALVVEDDFLIAFDIREQLAGAGFEVMGLASSVAKALKLIAERGCDVAVLNVNLGDETSEPIARKLEAAGKPFVVLSGYDTNDLRPLFNGATILMKPASALQLVAAVRRCIDVAPKAAMAWHRQ